MTLAISMAMARRIVLMTTTIMMGGVTYGTHVTWDSTVTTNIADTASMWGSHLLGMQRDHYNIIGTHWNQSSKISTMSKLEIPWYGS